MDNDLLSHLVRDYKLDTRVFKGFVIHTLDDADSPPHSKLRQECWQTLERHPITLNDGHASLQECRSGSKNKRVVKHIVHKPRAQERWYPRAIEAASIFSHSRYGKYFPKFLGWYQFEESFHMIMEYFPLGDLYTFVQENPLLSENESSEVAAQALRGLQVLHQRGFAHGNLKPQNILIQRRGSSSCPESWWIKLADFGGDPSTQAAPDTMMMADEGSTFPSPEITEKESQIGRQTADLWDLGVTVFFMLTKSHPTDSRQLSTSMFHLSSLNEYDISTDCRAFIEKLTKSEAEQRPDVNTAILLPWVRDRVPNQATDHNLEDILEILSSLRQDSAASMNDSNTLMSNENDESQDIIEMAENFDNLMSLDVISYINKRSQPKTPLFLATEMDNLELVKSLLEKGANANLRNKDGNRPLHAAAEQGLLAAAKLLLDYGAKSSLPNDKGCTALWNAADRGHTELVRLLLQTDTKETTKASKRHKWTPIYTASKKGFLEIVTLLQEARPEFINTANDHGLTPLHAASEGGHHEVVEYLLKNGADPAIRTDSGVNALYHAADKGYLKVTELLLEARPGLIDWTSGELEFTAISRAALNGHSNLVWFLLGKGADLKIRTTTGETPLANAASKGHPGVVKILSDAMPGLSKTTDNAGWMPMNTAVNNGHFEVVKLLWEVDPELINIRADDGWTPVDLAADNGHLEIMHFLINRGADFNTPSSQGWTPLISAASKGHLDVVEFLVQQGADLDPQAPEGWTAVNLAAGQGHLDIVEFLINQGADVNIESDGGWTPVITAAGKGHLDILEFLVRKGLDFTTPSSTGSTPIKSATISGHLDIVEFLINEGADLDIPDSDGWTLVNLAADEGRLDMVELLVTKGADLTIPNNHRKTPIESARKKNHKAVVELILAQHSREELTGDMAQRLKRSLKFEEKKEQTKRARVS